MATLIDMNREIHEIFHELSPKERMKAMRNTMGKVARDIRKIAVKDLSALNYVARPPKGMKAKGNRAKKLKSNIVAIPYRRAIGFHVTVASRQARAGGHTKVDHLNRWGQWKPAARWLDTGTAKQEARPFMDNAARELARVESYITQTFEEKVRKVAEKHNGI